MKKFTPLLTFMLFFAAFANSQNFESYDFVWCDFEDEYTNVGGFISPINNNTILTEMPGEGAEGGTAFKLEFVLNEDQSFTGLVLWAFPDMIDVSDYSHFAIRIKADQVIEDVSIILRDDVNNAGGRSHHTINVGTEWEDIFIALSDFEALGDSDEADLTIMHAIQVAFEKDLVSEAEGTVYVDLVGFNEEGDVFVPDVTFNLFDVNVYPNPARNQVNVETAPGSEISLFSITGSLISQIDATNGMAHFDVSGLNQGLYIIRVIHEGTTVSKKIHVH